MGPFTKSERRKFERDVYDYAEALGLDHTAAKKQVIKARGFCGEEDYDSDNSALGEEVDNSADILKRLGAVNGPKPEVLPSIEDKQTGQARKQIKPKPSPKKSPYFSSSITTALPPRKRKADKDIRQSIEEEQGSGEGDKHSKRRKHKSGNSEVNSVAASDTKEARKVARKAQKAQERRERHSATASLEKKGNALDPTTEAEAHKNFLRSNQRDPHEHVHTLDQTEEESSESAKQGRTLVEKLRGDIRFENDKQLDLYNHGQMKNVRKEVKDDLKILKETREAIEDADKQVREKKHKKRKSGASQADGDHNQNNEKANRKAVNGHKHKAKARKQAEDFF